MREIKFRGLRDDGKGWVCGDLVNRFKLTLIHRVDNGYSHYNDIKPESVGQFTGLQDKNGVDIYFDDKLFWNSQGIGVVKMGESGKIYARGEECYIEYSSFKKCEVIGNIHETK